MVRGRGTIAAIIQASLWDAVTLLAGYPALANVGYFRMSLRDKRLTKTYSRPAGAGSVFRSLKPRNIRQAHRQWSFRRPSTREVSRLGRGLAGSSLRCSLCTGSAWHSFSFGTLFRSCLVRSDMGFDGAGRWVRGVLTVAGLEKMPGFAMGFMFVVFLVRGEYNQKIPNQFFRGEEIPDIVGRCRWWK